MVKCNQFNLIHIRNYFKLSIGETNMNQLINAIQNQQNKTTTLNGAKAIVSTKNRCLDLFAAIGGMRGKDSLPLFIEAFHEDEELAIRVALWARDARQGAGERHAFRVFITWLANNHYKIAQRIVTRIPELGRWDDLLSFHGTPVWPEAVACIKQGLKDGHGLCAKWMPRKGTIANNLRVALGYTPKQYRKTLVNLTKVVEQQMCAQQWTEIEYSKVPSKAAQIYSNAFKRHDADGYSNYKNKLITGAAKINAGAVYPHEVMHFLRKDVVVANAQWNALPDFVPEGLNFLPVIDCSGSMGYLGSGKTYPIDIAIGLGLYLSERNKSAFKNAFITFSEKPTLQYVQGSLNERAQTMRTAQWGMNTNIRAVFELILTTALRKNVAAEHMPNYILIVSDMQFDACCKSNNNYKEIKKLYKASGYDCPVIVFWNVNHHGNFQTKFDKEGTIEISGYSPAIVKTILTGDYESITPYNQMLNTIMQDRYAF